jgi:phospholipase C
MRVEDRPDIDFDIFKIKLNMQFGVHNHLLDLAALVDVINAAIETIKVVPVTPQQVLVTWSFGGKSHQLSVDSTSVNPAIDGIKAELIGEFVNTDVSVNVKWEPDGIVAESIEGTINKKIFDALNSKDSGYRDALNRAVTRWLAGGNFYVVGVHSDEHSLFIDYVLPPDQLEPFPENMQPALDPGLLANIDHIVVLMMENRSFDHMLGYLSKEGGGDGIRRADIDGLHGGEANSDHKGHSFASFPLPDTAFPVDPPHGHVEVTNQIDGGKMDGFAAEFASQIAADGVDFDPGKIMGYHRADHVSVYDALAREFLTCQRWFAAHPGPTFPNRFYMLTGRLNRDSSGNWETDNFSGADFKPVATRTIFDHLTDHGVSWRYYEDRYCTLRMYARYTFDDNVFIGDMNDFFASTQAGALPSVSFIDPNFGDEPDGGDNADGPPADIAAGQNLIGRVVNAVLHGPKWNKTLLVITYDEHGGFFDHVNPLAFRDNAKPVSGIDYYGVRVPAFVVSPWVDRGKVVPATGDTTCDFAFDHTSIAKTIARRFMSANPPDMGERMAAASDLSKVLRSTPRQDIPSIPVPPAPPPKPGVARQAPPSPNSDDFREVMRFIHSQYPIRK